MGAVVQVPQPAVPFLVITGALIFPGVLLYKAYSSGATGPMSSGLLGGPTLKGLLRSVGAALSGVFTFLTIQGRPSLGRSAGVANGAPGQADTGRAYIGGSPRVGSYGTGRALVGVVAELKEDVLSNVVEQLRLEELNLAVNEPLVRCVLALNDRRSKKGGDPLKDAERFLRLLYGDQSNIDRLRPAFKDLYKHQ